MDVILKNNPDGLPTVDLNAELFVDINENLFVSFIFFNTLLL